jgi:hypothetical protein
MPDWATVAATTLYWRDMLARAFWASLLFFFETRAAIWKGIFIIAVGMVVTTLLVRVVRAREAFTEHLKANIAIVIAGGMATWVIVLIGYAIAEPFFDHREVATQLEMALQETRTAVIARQGAELRTEEISKQKQPKADYQKVSAATPNPTPYIETTPRMPSISSFPASHSPAMYIPKSSQLKTNLVLAFDAFLDLSSPDKPGPLCRLKITAPQENTEIAGTCKR